jgi:hypothetical protein
VVHPNFAVTTHHHITTSSLSASPPSTDCSCLNRHGEVFSNSWRGEASQEGPGEASWTSNSLTSPRLVLISDRHPKGCSIGARDASVDPRATIVALLQRNVVCFGRNGSPTADYKQVTHKVYLTDQFKHVLCVTFTLSAYLRMILVTNHALLQRNAVSFERDSSQTVSHTQSASNGAI